MLWQYYPSPIPWRYQIFDDRTECKHLPIRARCSIYMDTDNKLPLNLDKCSHLTFKGDIETFYLENDAVEIKCLEKDLGLIVQNDLKWNRHIDNACSKGLKIFYMIKRNVSNLPYQSKLDLYKSMIVSKILYASCCFGLSMYVSRQLENLQKRIVPWILCKKTRVQRSLVQTQTFTADDVSTTERRPHAFETDTRSLPRWRFDTIGNDFLCPRRVEVQFGKT